MKPHKPASVPVDELKNLVKEWSEKEARGYPGSAWSFAYNECWFSLNKLIRNHTRKSK